jgi:hypothetical protein
VSDAGATGTIVIRPEYGFGARLYTLFDARARVNGRDVFLTWRERTAVEVPSGHCKVAVWSRWMIYGHVGYAEIEFDVTPGAVVEVVWTNPHFTFEKGTIRAELLTPPVTGTEPGEDR